MDKCPSINYHFGSDNVRFAQTNFLEKCVHMFHNKCTSTNNENISI